MSFPGHLATSCHFLSLRSTSTSLPVPSPYFYVTSYHFSTSLSVPVPSLLYVISGPFCLPLHHFLSPLPTSMSLPVPSSYFRVTSHPVYLYIPSCPLSLLPCHFLSLLLHHFLPPFPTSMSLPAHSPYVYVTSCPHRYAHLWHWQPFYDTAWPASLRSPPISTPHLSHQNSYSNFPVKDHPWGEGHRTMQRKKKLMAKVLTDALSWFDGDLWNWDGSSVRSILKVRGRISIYSPVRARYCMQAACELGAALFNWGPFCRRESTETCEHNTQQLPWSWWGLWTGYPSLHHPNLLYGIILSLQRVQRTWKCHLYPLLLFSHKVVSDSVTPSTAACQVSLSLIISQSLLKLMATESKKPSNYLILCCPLLLLPSNLPSIRVFSNESALCIRWPKYWSSSFNISPSNEYSGLISFRIDWLDLFAIQGTLKSLAQHHSSKASVLRHSVFFMVQLTFVPLSSLKFH